MSTSKKVRFLALSAVIAALYAVLTYVAAALNLAYGAVQFRFSEALTVLPVFTPAAIPGLTVGCLIANLGSPLGDCGLDLWPSCHAVGSPLHLFGEGRDHQRRACAGTSAPGDHQCGDCWVRACLSL